MGNNLKAKIAVFLTCCCGALPASYDSVLEQMRVLAANINCPDSFHVVDLSRVRERYELWKECLPTVIPYYAVKVNHDPKIVALLAQLGTGFDCASSLEMDQVLNLSVEPDRIIFAHPRKPFRAIAYAQDRGVAKMVFDSLEELDKMMAFHPQGEYLLRIATDDSHSVNRLSSKFGATLDEAREIIDVAVSKGANLTGIAFHVGSNCAHIPSYQKGIEDAAYLFAYAQSRGKRLTVLDLGGGWPGNNEGAFRAIASAVNEALQCFGQDVRLIAEPGRFIVTSCTSAAVRVLGKSIKGEGRAYYLANGIYGLFLSSLYYGYDPVLVASEGWDFHPLNGKEGRQFSTTFWGPTCDSGDKILEGILFPEVETGEFIYSHNVGAYTVSLQTPFNQIPPSEAYYLDQ